jgi:hypothetical protein
MLVAGRLVRLAVLLLVVLLALPAGVAWGRTVGGAAVSGHPAISGFRQHAEVDRDRYEEQEPVVLTYRVCRSRPWPATTNSPGRGSLAPARGNRVEPDDYRFEVWCLVSPRDEPDEQTPRPIEMSPFVIAP